MMPLGLAVVPLVYSRESRSSESIGSHGHEEGSSLTPLRMSCSQTSRPCFMMTSPPVLLTTTHVLTVGDASNAASALTFSGTRLPLRQPSSWVIRNSHCISLSRPERDSPLNPQ